MVAPLSQEELVIEVSGAIRRHSAVLFAGAGLSIASGYPSWDDLIAPLLEEAKVPAANRDAPLSAEYVRLVVGEDRLRQVLLENLSNVGATPSKAVKELMQLPIDEYWTTNYDTLLEQAAVGGVTRILRDSDYGISAVSRTKRLTKMHGSLSESGEGSVRWEVDPTLTRTDYERYENDHPSMWALLKANFLTRSILFLGFSFDDPNIGVLLRISRSLPTNVGRPVHYTVLRAPSDPDDARNFELLISDLENSGVRVHVIHDFLELDLIAKRLAVRSRDANLFIAGSGHGAESPVALAFGTLLGSDERRPALVGLGSPAVFAVSIAARQSLLGNVYRPEDFQFYFRAKDDSSVPSPTERIGVSIYTDMDVETLRPFVIQKCRAMIVFGGGERTTEEINMALEDGLSVIPVASSGGAAREAWERLSPDQCRLYGDHVAALWERLASGTDVIAAQAAKELSLSGVFGSASA